MKCDEIRWTIVDRENLLDVLLGELKPQNIGFPKPPDWGLRGTGVAIGYRVTYNELDYAPPFLIIIPDDSATETLSWLRTFAEEISPLSQYGRVVLASEWRKFEEPHDGLLFSKQRSDRWASVAVGEALSQMEGETSLQDLPLSRFSGCFTTPIARSSLLWRNDEATHICADRLRRLEGDRRFARRPVSVDQLLPMWSIVSFQTHEYFSPSEAVTLVLHAASNYLEGSGPNSVSLLSSIYAREFSGLSSDSVEQRVGAFNRLSLDILAQVQSTKGTASWSAMAGVVLAAAAFLVGRSTSHVFLLHRTQRFAPTAAAWFGTIAALAGSRAWDKAWLKAVKGAERWLWPEFSWVEVPNADICWSEFAWLAKTFEGSEVFLNLPKMLPRTLNIEIIPGVACQFRLEGEPATKEPSKIQEPSAREQELQDALKQFISLSHRVGGLLEQKPSGSGGSVQLSFNVVGSINKNKTQRTKKPKQDTNDG